MPKRDKLLHGKINTRPFVGVLTLSLAIGLLFFGCTNKDTAPSNTQSKTLPNSSKKKRKTAPEQKAKLKSYFQRKRIKSSFSKKRKEQHKSRWKARQEKRLQFRNKLKSQMLRMAQQLRERQSKRK